MPRVRFDPLKSEYRLIRACLDGEQAIRDAGQLYTPKPSAMQPDDYVAYLARGSFYDAPAATLRLMTGLALRKDPILHLPARLAPLRLRATVDKAPFLIMVEDIVREVLAMGRYGLLLDFPRAGNTALTTPHFVGFNAENIDEVETAYVDGMLEVVRVVLATDERHDGADVFLELALEDSIYQIRRFVRQGPSEKRVDIEVGIIPQVNGRALDFIPFLMVSHQGIRPSDVRPPFSGLCRVALSHFRNSCDREHAIFLTSAPTPWVSGSLTEDRIPRAIGAGALWVLPEGAQVGMLEFTGAGVSAMKELMEEKIEVMAQLGARMLTTTVNRNESIETATQRTRGELSLLHGTVVSVAAGINKLLRIAAEWVGAPPAEAHVEMSRDFIEATLNGKQIKGLVKLWQSGGISHRTLYENLQAGEVASPDRTFEQEREMIADEGGDMGATMLRLPVAS